MVEIWQSPYIPLLHAQVLSLLNYSSFHNYIFLQEKDCIAQSSPILGYSRKIPNRICIVHDQWRGSRIWQFLYQIPWKICIKLVKWTTTFGSNENSEISLNSKQRSNKFTRTKAQKQQTKTPWKKLKYAKNVHVSFPTSRSEFFDVIG